MTREPLVALIKDRGSPLAHRHLQDGMKVQWDPLYIANIVEQHIQRIGGKLDAVSSRSASMHPCADP
jgi:hypothetical protein